MISFLLKWKKHFTYAALISCFVNILQLTFPFYMFSIYNNVIISYSMSSLLNITAAAFFAITIIGFFSYIRSRLLSLSSSTLSLNLRQSVYSLMIKGSVIDNRRAYQGGLNDLEVLRSYFSSPSVNALFDAPWVPFYLALIYLFHPVLGIIATGGALVMLGLSVLQEILVRKSMKEANATNAKNLRFVDSFIRNVEVINGMGMIRAISDRFIRKNKRAMALQTRSSYIAGTVQALIKPLQNAIQVLIYCIGAYFAMTEGFDVGLMVAASIIMGRGLAPLMQLMSSWQQTTQAKESYLRLKDMSAMIDQQTNPMSLPAPRGHIHVNKAAFKIGPHLLLKGVSFELRPGEFLGIIGPSGAGKTTLCRLLLGIWPSMGGKVSLDGNDIFLWNKQEVGPYIGYLPQEVELFPGTVAENIARMGCVDEARVDDAIALCGIKEMVDGFPRGKETQIAGDSGIGLSGGQKQKIGLARAVYQFPGFLVLDEPTSNLDETGEYQVLSALEIMKKEQGTTCIMVTHKPALLQSMDKILVLKDGRVALFGPRDEVFAKFSGGSG